MLPRRTPLRRTAGPKRGTGLVRGGRIRQARRLEPAEVLRRRTVRAEVFQRDGGCLLAHHQEFGGGCYGQRCTPHHLLKASAGGPYMADNLVTLCAHHNDWVEDHPTAAHAVGLVVRRGEVVALAWQRMRIRGLVA